MGRVTANKYFLSVALRAKKHKQFFFKWMAWIISDTPLHKLRSLSREESGRGIIVILRLRKDLPLRKLLQNQTLSLCDRRLAGTPSHWLVYEILHSLSLLLKVGIYVSSFPVFLLNTEMKHVQTNWHICHSINDINFNPYHAKVISFCHQYWAKPACMSMLSNQALYYQLNNFKFSSWYPQNWYWTVPKIEAGSIKKCSRLWSRCLVS